MKEPELVTATQEQLDELLELARASFPDKQYKLLEGVLSTFVFVMLKLQNAKTSLRRFQQMLFGARTEHKRNLALGLRAEFSQRPGAHNRHRCGRWPRRSRCPGGAPAARAQARAWAQRRAGL